MASACKHAGIPSYGPHDLRHRFISILVKSGVPITIVQKVAGHGRASVTLDIYSHVILDEPADYVAASACTGGAQRPGRSGENSCLAGASRLMEDTGIEPVTFALPARRSPS